MRQLLMLGVVLIGFCPQQAIASKCYGEHECGACKNCRYCKNCNSGGEYCGVYYQSRNETPPWNKHEAPKVLPRHKKAA
jgi:hypothetical protein